MPKTAGYFNTNTPTANQFGDKDFKIPGFEIVKDGGKSGDIIGFKANNGSGHCGIVEDPGKTFIAAGRNSVNSENINKYTNDGNHSEPVIRRYTGK